MSGVDTDTDTDIEAEAVPTVLDPAHAARISRPVPSSVFTDRGQRLASYLPSGTIVNVISERGSAPAWYHQKTGEITLSLDFLDDVPDDVIEKMVRDASINDSYLADRSAEKIPDSDLTWGVVFGIFQHEAAHAKWSRWLYESQGVVKTRSERAGLVLRVMRLWEEVRIEKRAFDRDPSTRTSLRDSFGYLTTLLAENPPENAIEMSNLWVLTVGRAAAHIVTGDEVQGIHDIACTVLGDSTVETMLEILDEAVAWQEHWGLDRMIELAEEWLDLLGIEELELPVFVTGEDGDGDPTDVDGGSGSGGEGEGEEGEDGSPGHGKSEAGDGREPRSLTPEQQKHLLAEVRKSGYEATHSEFPVQTSNPLKLARQVFGKDRDKVHRGRSWRVRKPTHDERRHVVNLSAALSRISYSAPAVRKAPSALPPGRMRSRDAVRRSAERSQGRLVTAQPWERKKRRHTINPPMTLGLMTDTSGSMSWAEEMVASAAYIFANSVNRIGGRVGSVTFGDKADAVVWPGEVPTMVAQRAADGGSEAFDEAAAAIEGMMHFGHPGGAKILVVISDACLVNEDEDRKAEIWLERWRRAGTAVVWVGTGDYSSSWLPDWVTQITDAEIERAGSESDYTTALVNIISGAIERAFAKARGGTT